MGDPLRQNIKNAATFFDELRFKNQVLPQFQLKQGVTKNGEPLQTAFPSDEIRFLNEEEISTLQEKTDHYRSFRFLNLRELSFPRLLSRHEFPYDTKHDAKENISGPPPSKGDLYYDVKQNQFVHVEPKSPAAEPRSAPQEIVEHGPEVPILGTPEPSQQKKIIEFTYDLFQEGTSLNNGNNEPPLEPTP